MAIDSDVMGADARLAVSFYKKAVENVVKTQDEGRPIYEERVFVRILVPGDSLSIIDTFAHEDHKKRFPIQWQHFLNKQGNNDDAISGTPLNQWPLISTTQAEELRGMKFYTVEQVASASDQQIARIGMLTGMSPYTFRDKAKAFLNLAQESAEKDKRDAEIKALQEQNAQIKAESDDKMLKLQTQIEVLMASMAKQAESKPRGRKPKQESVEE
jgi:hypothetical protein